MFSSTRGQGGGGGVKTSMSPALLGPNGFLPAAGRYPGRHPHLDGRGTCHRGRSSRGKSALELVVGCTGGAQRLGGRRLLLLTVLPPGTFKLAADLPLWLKVQPMESPIFAVARTVAMVPIRVQAAQ